MPEFEDVAGFFRRDTPDADAEIRSAAFEAVSRLTKLNGILTAKQISGGFQFQGTRIPFVNPQRGIFKPRQMHHLLSIRTVINAPGRRIWYDDQREVHNQIYKGEETVDYAFMGDDPNAADNRWLRDAMDLQIPIIYFLGTAPGLYQAIVPTFIVGFDARSLKAKLVFSEIETAIAPPQSPAERRYALRTVKQRLHQASFREMVISAYNGRCAISGLPEPLLLDAAHIIDDGDELLGHPTVKNGLLLSKIHHAAFDNHMIGIDPDYRIHISERLLALKDGPTLDALRKFDGALLREPVRSIDLPDRERLARRFERFKAAA